MATEAIVAPRGACVQPGFAHAWVAAFRQAGGIVAAAGDRKMIWFPINREADREQVSTRKALMSLLDAAGADARNAVFAAAQSVAR